MGKVMKFPSAERFNRLLSLVFGLICLVPATVGVAAGVFGWLPHDPMDFVGAANAAPSAATWLGTDALGRDLFSRLGAAAAYFTPPGALAMAVALIFGCILEMAQCLQRGCQYRSVGWLDVGCQIAG